MSQGVRFVCNQLYEYLFSDRVKPMMKFLTDEEFRDPSLDLSGVEGILAQPFLVQKPLLDRAPDVKWIQGTGAGYDAADVDEIRRRGLTLTNSRGVMSISIAEDVLCKMLFFSRRVRQVEQDKKDHHWNSFGMDQWMCTCYTDLYGKKLGILGYGSLGHEIALRAKAFGMEVNIYDIHPITAPEVDHCHLGPQGLDAILRESDYLVLTMPLNPHTHHLINDEAFDKMKSTAMFLNVARGPIVDEEALYRALSQHKIAWAACDVFEQEPLSPDSPLWELDNMFISSHKAGMGETWTRLIGDLMERNILHFIAGEPLENVIDLSQA